MESSDRSFPVVGIGASAGGLEAVSELLEELSPTPEMAFLLVQHLDPRHPSILTEILAKKAVMTVATAVDGVAVEPGHFYVIPPNRALTVADGVLRLRARDGGDHPHRPVNILFRSLAEQYGPRAVGVVLSGTDSDGSEGLEEIKAAGGITMVQAPASAKFDGMPKSAIATGCVDRVLTPKELGQEMLRIAHHPYLSAAAPLGAIESQADHLMQIFRLLRGRTGTDFSRYKSSTVQRRLARRMALLQLDGLNEYIDLLKEDPDEIQALAQDFLIRVTGFFRDPETFAGLAETVFPALLANRLPLEELRIWVPGCASGEEVYSIAIVLEEYLDKADAPTRIRIFGTDLSESAIEKARTGFYADHIADEVSAERLQRFFVKLDDHYQIVKSIRDLCVFARHDVTRDPPFSRLDLVSCRNLLIYFDQPLQRQIISLFHYALKPLGFLVLGTAETIGRSDFFRVADGRQIYQPVPTRTPSQFPVETAARPGVIETFAAVNPDVIENARGQKQVERLLLTRYAPAAVLIDDNLNAVYFHGETSRYLEHASGAASLQLQNICRPGLLVELTSAVREAQASKQSVFRKDVHIELLGEVHVSSFEVIPLRLPGTELSYSLILFNQSSTQRTEGRWPSNLLVRLWKKKLLAREDAAAETEKNLEIVRLRRELNTTRAYLQTMIEEHEAAKEEMKSKHEEALSANEEFQTTNEELETAKEELQSTNEELGVTNQELGDRNRELSERNDEISKSRSYLDAIIETLRESLLVLDGDLRVQKANHEFYQTFRLRPEETLQRYIYDLGGGTWNIPELRQLLGTILPENRAFRDFEVAHDFPALGQKTMLLNARRLPSSERRDEMILLAIEDITDRQLSQRKLIEADQRKNNFLATLAHELRNPLAPMRMGVQLLRRNVHEVKIEHLDMLDRQIQKLVLLVDALVDIARIERDHIELRKELVDLADVVNQAIETSRHHLDNRLHQVSLALPAEPIYVLGDPIRLEQVISNLLNNAAKYTDPGGEIAVSVERVDGDATIAVRDNGVGIAPALLPQLFEMFFQADVSLDRADGGLGIGLSVAKRLVELQGGRIEGRSEGLGKGSEFTVRLPAVPAMENSADPAGGATADSRQPSAAAFLRRRVLIVDDNADTAASVAEFATLLGHEVVVAHDGPAALELVPQFRPDIALIDIGLPQMNGYELARHLRGLPEMAAVPLVAVTGYAREEDRQAALEAGFRLHLAKPIEPGRLESLLATLQ